MRDSVRNVNGAPGINGGDSIGYEVRISNTGSGAANTVRFRDTLDPKLILNNGSIQTTPIAINDTVGAVGNVPISITAPGPLANDFDVDGVGPVLSVSAGTTSANGGTVSMSSNGAFTYNPPLGFEGMDSFGYTLSDGEGNTDTARIYINVSGMIWFINNTAAAGDGRMNTPFNSLAAFMAVNNGAGNNPAAGDRIFIYESGTSYTGPVTLLNNQRLIGQDASATVATLAGFTIPPGTTLPATNSGNATTVTITSPGTGITLAQRNRLHGFTIGASPTMALSGTSFDSLTVGDLAINNTSGPAISLNSGFLAGTFTQVASSAGTTAINLVSVNSSSIVSMNNLAITGTTGATIVVTGGNAQINFIGNTTQASNAPLLSVSGGHTGTLTFPSVGTLSATNGTGLQFNNADGTYNMGGTMTLNGGDAGVDIIGGSAGTFNFGISTSITNPTGTAFYVSGSTPTINCTSTISTNSSRPIHIDGMTGGSAQFNRAITATGQGIRVNGVSGSAQVTLQGDLSGNGTSAWLDVQGNTGGTITFSGASKTFSTSTSTAVNLQNNNGATISFTNGGLAITTTTTGFSATGGGTVNVTGNNNTISSGNATGLNVVNTTIGASGMIFRSIASSGGSSAGIILDNTGSSGGLTVTGNGSAGTGGTIANKSGSDGSTTTGVGVYLNRTRNASLNWMQLNDFQNYAVLADSADGFTLGNSTVNGANGSNTGSEEGSITFTNATGTVTIDRSTVSGGLRDNIRVVNNSGTLSSFNFNRSTLGHNNTTSGSRSLIMLISGSAVANVDIDSSIVLGALSDAVWLEYTGTSSGDVTLSNDSLHNTHPSTVSGAGLVAVTAFGSADVTYTVANCFFRGSSGVALFLGKSWTNAAGGGSPGDGTMSGTIENCRFGVVGDSNSSSRQGSAIFLQELARGSHTSLVRNNTIRGYNNFGIGLQAGGTDEGTTGLTHDGALNVTIQSNTIEQPGNLAIGFPINGINLNGGTNSGDDYSVCLTIGDPTDAGKRNIVTNSSTGTNASIRLRQRMNTTVRLPGYTGPSNSTLGNVDTALSTYLTSRTQGTFSVTSTSTTTGGFFNTSGGNPCATP